MQKVLRPQPGAQEKFLSSSADIAIFGGAAGGTKTFSLLLEPCRHIHNPGFRSLFLRRTTPMLTQEGGAWDESQKVYPYLKGTPLENKLRWTFRSGSRIKMSHIEYESYLMNYHSAQYCLIEFDELVQFTQKMFFYMLSRNRSVCGVKPYIRAGTNPDPNSWVRNFLDWWIGPDGFPIKERSGILRYFARNEDKIIWVDKDWKSPEGDKPLSVTFIPAKLEDNPILMTANPEYRQSLNSMARVDRLRLKDGNWNVKEEDGMFEVDWFGIVERAPRNIRMVRYWDRAATEATEKNDPDWTAGALCGIFQEELYIIDVRRFRGSPGDNEEKIKKTASVDGKGVQIFIEEEPGSSGKDSISHYQRNVLKGCWVTPDKPTGKKTERAKPWCAQAEFGHVFLVRGEWNTAFLSEVETFPNGKKDQVDAVSGAYSKLISANIAVAARLPI